MKTEELMGVTAYPTSPQEMRTMPRHYMDEEPIKDGITRRMMLEPGGAKLAMIGIRVRATLYGDETDEPEGSNTVWVDLMKIFRTLTISDDRGVFAELNTSDSNAFQIAAIAGQRYVNADDLAKGMRYANSVSYNTDGKLMSFVVYLPVSTTGKIVFAADFHDNLARQVLKKGSNDAPWTPRIEDLAVDVFGYEAISGHECPRLRYYAERKGGASNITFENLDLAGVSTSTGLSDLSHTFATTDLTSVSCNGVPQPRALVREINDHIEVMYRTRRPSEDWWYEYIENPAHANWVWMPSSTVWFGFRNQQRVVAQLKETRDVVVAGVAVNDDPIDSYDMYFRD